MSLLVFLGRASRSLFVSALVTSVLSGLAGSWVVVLINRSLEASAEKLPALGLEFALVCGGMLVVRWFSQAQFARLRHRTVAKLRQHISQHFAEAPYRELERWGAARLWAVLIEDIATVSEFFVALPRLLTQGAIVIGCLGYLAWLSWQAFLFALAMVLLGSKGRSWGGHKASESLERARAEENELHRHFQGLLGGAKELRLNAARRAAFIDGVLLESIGKVRRERRRGLMIHVAAASWGSFLFFVVIGSVVFGLSSVLSLPSEVRAGYTLMLLYMLHPMELLMEALPELSRTRIALDHIREVGVGIEAPETTVFHQAPEPFRSVRLRGVTHTYRHEADDSVFTVGPLDLELRPGEVVFVIGGNGSGKTTLAKLLVGLYAPESGQIELNGASVLPEQREAYRQCFSCVFSDFHLFEQLLGLAGQGLDERALQLLRSLELDRHVLVREGTFSTTQLSLGQRKRLALLVARLEDRPVYVFDEWAADQDPAYKDVFYRELLPELRARGKAVLVITHDDHYFGLADRCLRLESGQLGTWQGAPAPVLAASVGAASHHSSVELG